MSINLRLTKVKKSLILITVLFLFSCKSEDEKIVFEFPKDTKMKFEEFNEGLDESSTGIIYFGDPVSKIKIKYYLGFIKPPKRIISNVESFKYKKIDDSVQQAHKPFFYPNTIQIFESPLNSDFKDLNNHNLKITIQTDTIPLYRNNQWEERIKIYKAFPILVKNISQKELHIPLDFYWIPIYFKNEKNKWQSVRNEKYMLEGFMMHYVPTIKLKPKQILIYSVPYFKGGNTREVKVGLYDAFSHPFQMKIPDDVIKNQRESQFIE